MKQIILTFILIISGITSIFYSKDILKAGFPKIYKDVTASEAARYGLDENLIYSVIRAESRYDENAISYAGAKGLMQITDETFAMIRNNIDIGDDVFDAKTNIKAGSWYLYHLYTQLGDLDDTIRAYNCGINNLSKKIPQTVIFKDRVFMFYDIYLHLYSD
jgi:soluble lytic murein transglycosylase